MQKNTLTNRINILHLSDTHSQHRRLAWLPDADVPVHFGDFISELNCNIFPM